MYDVVPSVTVVRIEEVEEVVLWIRSEVEELLTRAEVLGTAGADELVTSVSCKEELLWEGVPLVAVETDSVLVCGQ